MRHALLVIALAFWLAGLAPATALAQSTGGGAPTSARRSQVVVIADASDTETGNARLRAVVFDVARGYGLAAERPADVVETARNSNALEAGRVSTAVAPLGTLRRALGASVLVRVSRDWERDADMGLRVTVVASRDSESKVVSAPIAEPEPALKRAVHALLERVLGKVPAAAASSPASGGGEATAGGADVQWVVRPKAVVAESPQDARHVARAWAERGGVRPSYEVRGMLTSLLIPHQNFSSQNPVTHAPESGRADTLGIGGGIGVRVGMLYLPLGDPRVSSSTFAAFRLGLGIDGNVLYVRPPAGYSYSVNGGAVTTRDTRYADRAWLYGVASGQLGLHIGVGTYATRTIWRGVLIGVAYSPAFLYRLDIASLSGAAELNPAGVELDLDITSLQAQRNISAEPQIRLSALLLPRVRSDLPWLLSLGLGAAWY